MTLDEIKQAVDAGKVVHWSNCNYQVVKSPNEEYLIQWGRGQGHFIGLTWKDGKTLNGLESEFYIDPVSKRGE